ncbi:MAG: winged helix DNA-binding domain-containing protein [Mycobacteriales bacterium]
MRLTAEQVRGRRLRRQLLDTPSHDVDPAGVAAALCGVHAQVMSAAELAIGLRLAGATRTGVRAALWTDGTLVKAFGPRGTVHLLPRRDLATWAAALSAVPPPPNNHPAHVRMTAEQTEEVVAAVAAATADAALTIDELHEAVVAATGPWAGDLVMEAFQGKWPRWRQALPLAGLRGAVCFGPNRGRNVTYTNPGVRPVDGAAAVDEVVRRYLRAFGPATPAGLARWLAAPPGWARERFDALAGDLTEVDVDGHRAWLLAGDAAEAGPARGVRLLPYFDAYAYAVTADPYPVFYPGRAAVRAKGNFQVLLVDGAVAGVWHQRRSGRTLGLTVEALVPLSARHRRELDEQVDRVGEILEGRPRLTLGPVTVGGHA